MALQTSPHDRPTLVSVAALRWPYRVLSVNSPSGLTLNTHASLLHHGIDLHPYADGASALLSLTTEDPAAILAPTDMEGVDLVRFVGAVVAWSEVPIIIGLRSDAASYDLAYQALDRGARALLALPFLPEQLASAVQHLGLKHTGSALPLSFGPVTLDRDTHQVVVSGTPLHFSPREFLLVEHLLNEAPRVVSIDEIATVIGNSPGVSNAVRVRKYVEKVRRKIDGLRPGQPSIVQTVRGLGYRLSL